MALVTDIHLNRPIQLGDLLELGKDYCSEQLGRFFQNNYSPPALEANKFVIPAKLATRNERDCFAICVMMNNHIVDLKYFSDILPDWDKRINTKSIISGHNLDKINALINDQRLLTSIKSFKKINDEIVIGRCRGLVFTPL